MPADASILKVTATDPRMDSNIAIGYSVNDTVNFRIDEDGVLYNNHQLDYEKGPHMYCLQVEAEAHGGRRWRRRKALAAIHIYVTDASEAPHFDSSQYYYSIPEFATPGTFVGKVVAYDDDDDLEHYALDGVEPPNMFIVDRVRGFIAVGRSPLDKQWVYHFRAVAIDYHGHVASVPVTVYIIASRPWYAQHMGRNKPENRHKPVFPECDSYDGVHVKENMTAGTPVVLVLATDEDTGQNGHVIYTLINGFDSFTVQASNQHGQITTTRRLDRDQGDKDFVLTVIGRDSAQEALQDSCSFRVVVEDVNDNAPFFDQPRYDQTLATDHRAGTTVLRVTASDLDAGDNGRISYSLLARHAPDLDYFMVDSSSGIMSLRAPLDGSMANSRTFELTAQAQDAGQPALSSTVPVSITVVSTGELPPTIVRQDPLRPSILENTTENTPVVTVCARSNLADSPNVYFTLINGNTKDTNSEGTFALRRLPDSSSACTDSSGVSIFVATRNLDYETVQAYTLLLQVVNDQNARLDERIPVEIVDVNDNAPLLQPFDGAVVENADGALITTIVAVDLDASPEFRELTYAFDALADEDVRAKFELKPNGELWTTKPLDREEVKQYRVPIQVTDGVPEHERMTTYWITVQDLNDVAPAFAPSGVFEVELPENRELGKPTGIRLPVHDPDIVSQHEYEIISGNEEEKFRIDSATGDVLVNRPLDFDHPVFDRNFTMRVRVSDGANAPAETEITIAVTNVNDLQPVFERANYTFTVTENADCNVTFGKVSAIDPDLPMSESQNILYYLSSLELANFTIGNTSGELSLKGCLDREAATRGTMTFYPRANDEGGRGHDANPATVELTILDLNDNHPHIRSPKPNTATIPENVDPENVDPILIQLDDVDEPGHGCPCQMDFVDSTPPALREKFNLTEVESSESQYILRPTTTLDREEQKVYKLPFLTRDSQGVSGIRFLTLEVGDENDSPMTDGTSSIKVYNYKGQFPAMVIGGVHVTDLDDYDLDSKTFEIDPVTSLDAQKHFRVDRESGDITMLEGTAAGTYTLRVKVRDSERREAATGRVTVNVVGLTKDAVMQSGSLRISSISAKKMMESSETAGGRSLYERLKREIANLHSIRVDQVDIFTLRDVDGGVDVRYNCHSSPYYSTVRLNAVMMQRRERVAESLGVEIPSIDMNLCLYEGLSPCGDRSCQHAMRPNLTAPLVVASETATMVGVGHNGRLHLRLRRICGFRLLGGLLLQRRDLPGGEQDPLVRLPGRQQLRPSLRADDGEVRARLRLVRASERVRELVPLHGVRDQRRQRGPALRGPHGAPPLAGVSEGLPVRVPQPVDVGGVLGPRLRNAEPPHPSGGELREDLRAGAFLGQGRGRVRGDRLRRECDEGRSRPLQEVLVPPGDVEEPPAERPRAPPARRNSLHGELSEALGLLQVDAHAPRGPSLLGLRLRAAPQRLPVRSQRHRLPQDDLPPLRRAQGSEGRPRPSACHHHLCQRPLPAAGRPGDPMLG
ncbi:DE-cadherin-like [Penaeus monodon]|uniref:DE-cadherin-like n=1 Tax=Penaeus monodon TaxID=6687 RepID=UPI0018A7B275|nr:DE-cadherin-like [Penaeus monodon]